MRAALASLVPSLMLLACGGRSTFGPRQAEPTLSPSGTGGASAGSGVISDGTGGSTTAGVTGTGGAPTGRGGTFGGAGAGGTGGAESPGGVLGSRDVDGGADRPRPSVSDAPVFIEVASGRDGGGEASGAFCASVSSAGLLVCDDFSNAAPETSRQFLPWKSMPSLTLSVSGGTLVVEEEQGFSASYAVLGSEMDFRNTFIEVTMSATTDERSLSAVCWGTPRNLISAGLQRDEQALYLHVIVNDTVKARLSADVQMAPGQYQRVRMEVYADGLIRCFVDDEQVLATYQDLSGLPQTLAPGINVNSYPPEQRFTFDDFVVRKL